MSDPAIAIPNLIYRYAESFDDGDLEGAAHLFDRGCLLVGGKRISGVEGIVAMWHSWVILYDGKPRTRHITTNPIIEVASDGRTASCRSQWTVFQATEDFALQPVASGRYHDRFALIDGEWHFTERAYGQVDLMGNASAHMRRTLASREN